MKKRQKSKMTMLIVGGLAAVSLVSVGFANWVITGGIPEDENITVTVGDVQNQSLTTTIIPAAADGTNLTLNFDNTTTQGSNNVFTGTGSEDMSFAIKFQIDGADISSKLASVKFEFDGGIAGSGAGNYNLLSDHTNTNNAIDYLAYPWLSNKLITFAYPAVDGKLNTTGDIGGSPASVGCTVVSSGTNSLVCTATFTFGWGKAFLNRNPANTPIGPETNASQLTRADLIDRLNKFNKAFTDLGVGNNLFNVKVTPVTK